LEPEAFWEKGHSMSTGRNPKRCSLLLAAVMVLLAVAVPVTANEALDWNAIALDVAMAGGPHPIIHSRTLTMVPLAMHDALNAVEQRGEPYVSAAALAEIPDSPQKEQGITTGRAAATALLTARKSDGASAKSSYTAEMAPGRWRSHPNPVPANPTIADASLAPGSQPAWLPQWAAVTPFVMAMPWQFGLPGRTKGGPLREWKKV
jgi:hypothetical protein